MKDRYSRILYKYLINELLKETKFSNGLTVPYNIKFGIFSSNKIFLIHGGVTNLIDKLGNKYKLRLLKRLEGELSKFYDNRLVISYYQGDYKIRLKLIDDLTFEYKIIKRWEKIR